MVFNDQTFFTVAVFFVEIIGRPHTGKTAPHDDHVIFFAGINGRFAEFLCVTVTDQMGGFACAGDIPVRAGIITHAAKTCPGVVIDTHRPFAACI